MDIKQARKVNDLIQFYNDVTNVFLSPFMHFLRDYDGKPYDDEFKRGLKELSKEQGVIYVVDFTDTDMTIDFITHNEFKKFGKEGIL